MTLHLFFAGCLYTIIVIAIVSMHTIKVIDAEGQGREIHSGNRVSIEEINDLDSLTAKANTLS